MLPSPSRSLSIVGVAAIVFGLLTLLAGGKALFGPPGDDAEKIVPFVLRFNFGAGFFYLAAGIGLLRRRRWSAPLAAGLTVATFVVALAFAVHVASGGAFLPRTIGALVFRTTFWAFVAWRAYVAFGREGGVRGRAR